jgi:mono/diheme cytochrome c family protein
LNLNRLKVLRKAAIAGLVAAGCLSIHVVPRPVDAAVQTPSADTAHAGAESYAKNCAVCHGDNREGNLPAFPPLAGIQHKFSDAKITEIVHAGKGRMPGFPDLPGAEVTALVGFLKASEPASGASEGKSEDTDSVARAGGELFRQNCAFCHGRDAMGGETGPDLTQSKLVLSDKTGEKITAVVREGRPEKKMPAFNFSNQELEGIVAFIRAREKAAAEHPGGRRGVAVEDLQTGNAEAGKQYFNGAGGCSRCHSPSGDLAGIASRFEGLNLERRMLYPEGAKSKVTVTLPSGETITGQLAYLDEFTVAMRDAKNTYRSWSAKRVRYSVDAPVKAHVEQFPKYTDDDIHNLMAYLQTLR